MTPKTFTYRILGVIGAFVVLTLVAGHLLGQPVLLSYVETGSMAPTLEPGDGFIAIPTALAGPVEPGDVIIFQAQILQGGGLTTHRVVDVTDTGYVTKGDANPVTDQDGREPIVQDAQVVAKALQIGGRVVIIPKLGAVVLAIGEAIEGLQLALARLLGIPGIVGTQGLAVLFFAMGIITFVVSTIRETTGSTRRRDRRRSRGVFDGRHLIVGLTILLVLITTASMVVPSGPHQYDVVSSSTGSSGVSVIHHGTTASTSYRVPSNGLVPVVVFLEPRSDHLTVSHRELYIPSNHVSEVTVSIRAPQETGHYRFYLEERRYLAILPISAIKVFYHIHPWLPILVIDTLLAMGFAGVAFGLVGIGPIRLRSRRHDRSLLSRIRRWLT